MDMPTAKMTREKVWAMPLDEIDVSDGYLFEDDTIGWYFERLRQRGPGPLLQVQPLRSVLVGDASGRTSWRSR
jgi:hypothetical protein